MKASRSCGVWHYNLQSPILQSKIHPTGMAARRWLGMINERCIVELSERIVREFQPDKIILFGSYAYGQPRADSDVDLLVVLPFEGRGFRKSLEILNRISPDFSVDLLARRPQDTAQRYTEGDPLIREALDYGKVLYERHG